MKLVFVAFGEAIDVEVIGLLHSLGIEGYTKWVKTLGKGASSGPHMLSHVWPNANNVVMACVQDDVAAKLMAGVRELRKTIGHEGVKAFSLPVADVT